MNLEQRLAECSIVLPAAAPAGARYTPAVVFENLARISGQLPRNACVELDLVYSRPALAFTFIRTFAVNAARPIMTLPAEMDTIGTAAI
jgi:hypothetical protein